MRALPWLVGTLLVGTLSSATASAARPAGRRQQLRVARELTAGYLESAGVHVAAFGRPGIGLPLVVAGTAVGRIGKGNPLRAAWRAVRSPITTTTRWVHDPLAWPRVIGWVGGEGSALMAMTNGYAFGVGMGSHLVAGTAATYELNHAAPARR